MKKNLTRGEEQKRKPRRLNLNRETLQVLQQPALLDVVRGGEADDVGTYSHPELTTC